MTPPLRRRSWLPPSGRSSSGAASRQRPQRPETLRVRNQTTPLPRHCSPTRSKRFEATTAPGRTSREARLVPAASAGAGTRTNRHAAASSSFMAAPLRKQRRPSHSRWDPPSQIQSLQVKRPLLEVFCLASLAALTLCLSASAASGRPRVLAVTFENEVNPVTQDYLTGEIDRANSEHYNAVAILLDTPGGLGSSMEKIVKAELASKVPVIVYVSPEGSRAA